MSTSRREILYQIAMAPLAAAQQHPAHQPAATAPAAHKRRFFTEHEFKTLQTLSQWIIPPDERSAGAIEAGTAEFIDVMCAADAKLAAAFTGGIAWLDHHTRSQHAVDFLQANREQQKSLLDQLAYRDRAPSELAPGVAFFALMRAWTVDAFFSSKEGVKDLDYRGNTALAEFNGCPDDVVKKLLENSPA